MARIQVRLGGYGPEMVAAVRDAATRTGTDDPEVHAMLASVYEKRSMPKEALAEINAAIKLDPQANYYFIAAKLLMGQKEYTEAERMLDLAIAANPNRSHFFIAKGEVRMTLGDDPGALKMFEKAESLNPEDHDAYLDQGIALDSMKEYGRAVEKIRQAVRLRPDIPELRYFLAVAYIDNSQSALAETELRKALELKPGYREALDLLKNMPAARPR